MDFQPQVSCHDFSEFHKEVTSNSDKILSLPLRSAVKLQGINQIQWCFRQLAAVGKLRGQGLKDSIGQNL
jgi:hypothetical protein